MQTLLALSCCGAALAQGYVQAELQSSRLVKRQSSDQIVLARNDTVRVLRAFEWALTSPSCTG